MIIPDKLKIIGRDYKVKFDPRLVMDDGSAALGHHKGAINAIIINSSYPAEIQSMTLLHEIIEAINHNFELGLEHNQICTLEEGLYQVLKDNNLCF